MNTQAMATSAKPSKMANLIDENLTKIAATLEDVADRVARVSAQGDVPANFASTAVKQIETLNGRVRSVDGERIVARSKDTIERHPAALTIIGAIAGAVIAQVAVVAVRNERKRVA